MYDDDDEEISSSPRARIAGIVLIAVFVGPTIIGMGVGLWAVVFRGDAIGLNALVLQLGVLGLIAAVFLGVRAYLRREVESEWDEGPPGW